MRNISNWYASSAPTPGRANFDWGVEAHGRALSATSPVSVNVRLVLYDVAGRSLAVFGPIRAGQNEFAVPSRIGAGTYFARLQAGQFSRTFKFVLTD